MVTTSKLLDPDHLRFLGDFAIGFDGIEGLADRLLGGLVGDDDDRVGAPGSGRASMPGSALFGRRCTTLSSETSRSAMRLAIEAITPGRSCTTRRT